MVWILWATAVAAWAFHTGLHRWKRVRQRSSTTTGRHRKPATLPGVSLGLIRLPATGLRWGYSRSGQDGRDITVLIPLDSPQIPWLTPGLPTTSGVTTDAGQPGGVLPSHIPEQSIRFGPPAGGEGQSHE